MIDKKRQAFEIFPSGGWQNQFLLKDCGLVPFLLCKNHNFSRAVLVGEKIEGETYPYLKNLPGLELDFLPENNSENIYQTRLDWINSNAKNFDLMLIYGAYETHNPLIDLYKKIRPDGKIYLATDMNIDWADRIEHSSKAFQFLLKNCDVVGASCRKTQKYLSQKWNVPVELFRNGFYNFANVSFDNLFERKENIILTVARIGTNQKQNEVMLEAFAKVADKIPSWKMRLVGSIKEKFQPYIENYFEEFPNLKDRVIFVGLIENKFDLMEEYKKAKIFCLSSKMEGAPNVAAEALYAGNFIITSAVDAASDMVDENNCGRIFPIGDIDALAKIFVEVCNDEKILSEGMKHAADYGRREFDMEKIVARLNYLLFGGD